MNELFLDLHLPQVFNYSWSGGSLSPVGVSVTDGRLMLVVAQAAISNAPTNPLATCNFFGDISVLVIGQRGMVHDSACLDIF